MEKVQKAFAVPYVVYVDFETFLTPVVGFWGYDDNQTLSG